MDVKGTGQNRLKVSRFGKVTKEGSTCATQGDVKHNCMLKNAVSSDSVIISHYSIFPPHISLLAWPCTLPLVTRISVWLDTKMKLSGKRRGLPAKLEELHLSDTKKVGKS